MDVREPLEENLGLSLHWQLPRHRSAPGEARRYITQALTGLLAAEDVDAAVLVTSELVTNVLLHAGSECELEVSLRGDNVVIRVSDRNERRPVRQAESDERPSGRGLQMIDTLCGQWGVVGTKPPAPAGKTVWCELSVSR